MRVVIAGGAGLIGRALTQDLLADGREVVILSRNPERIAQKHVAARGARWDGRTLEEWGRTVDGADAVVNLAGENLSAGLWTKQQKRRIVESRLDAGRALVQAIEAATVKPRSFIQASGVGYYGFRGDRELAEDDGPGDDWLARFAVDWEASSQEIEAMGVRRAIVRSGAVLTTEGGVLPKILLPFKLFVGGPVGSGRQWAPWIHIADEVGAIRFLMESDTASGPFNLVAPQPLTNAQMGRTLAKVIGRPFWMPAPAFALRLVLGELSNIILEGQRAIPHRLDQAGYRFHFPDLDMALRALLRE